MDVSIGKTYETKDDWYDRTWNYISIINDSGEEAQLRADSFIPEDKMSENIMLVAQGSAKGVCEEGGVYETNACLYNNNIDDFFKFRGVDGSYRLLRKSDFTTLEEERRWKIKDLLK